MSNSTPFMDRRALRESLRRNWPQKVKQQGLTFVDTELADGSVVSYWREDRYYVLNMAAQAELEQAANTLLGMYVHAGQYVIDNNLLGEMGIPQHAAAAIKLSWQDDRPDYHNPSVFGRFDIRYGPRPDLVHRDESLTVPKLYEFNADTPTSLVEASLIQHYWWQHYFQHTNTGQWNGLHERLLEAWVRHIREYQRRTGCTITTVHVSYTNQDPSGEDMMNAEYMAIIIEEAAKILGNGSPVLKVKRIYHEEVTVKMVHETEDYSQPPSREVIIDGDGESIQMLYKLYPLEWIFADRRGPDFTRNMLRHDGTVWVEPAWKALYSNKRMLVYLWRLFGTQPEGRYLLPAYGPTDDLPGGFTRNYVSKPNLGREGAGVTIIRNGQIITAGSDDYAESGYTLQQLALLPDFRDPTTGEHNHPVMGVWAGGYGNDTSAIGLGIREGDIVTGNTSFFAPHILTD